MIHQAVTDLIAFGLKAELIRPDDAVFCTNAVLAQLSLEHLAPRTAQPNRPMHEILQVLTDYAAAQGLCTDDVTGRDLFDTALMGCITPRPSEVRSRFSELYKRSPKEATDYLYKLSRDCNYIRTDRIARNLIWLADTNYGQLEITVNLSKPEKPVTTVSAVKKAASFGYPACLLCPENEGYAGRADHPARQNLRIVPMVLDGEDWFLQYSPYTYYNEHCIAFSKRHIPMVIDGHAIRQLLEFVTLFPHYFMGSNADLPIVGGSIFTHAHFQGGNHRFPLEAAPIETELHFRDYPDVSAGIVRWPMSVIRITGENSARLAALAELILEKWRAYTDASAQIFAETDGEKHNTITPIARRRGRLFELDLVLRNNLTTPELPLGVYHAHPEHFHIKQENIGLIEVMGLAILPPRLVPEMNRAAELVLSGQPLHGDALAGKHADWFVQLQQKYKFTRENVRSILHREIGEVYADILAQAGVFRRDEDGKAAFLRFTEQINR